MSYRRNYRSNTRSSGGGGWRGPPALEVLNESIVMSAAGAQTEIEVALLEEVGKLRFGRVKAMMITRIEIEVLNVTAGVGIDAALTTAEWFNFQITSSSQGTSEVAFSDKDCIFKELVYPIGTATEIVQGIFRFDLPHGGLPYFKKRIWFAADDGATQGQANTYHFKIYYYFKYLNKKQQTRIISQLQ